MPRYTYNGVTVTATERRSSDRDDKKYMRTVTWNGKDYIVHYGDPNLPMRRDNDEARQNFLSRHQCDTKKDPTKPGFWACLDWARPEEGKAMDTVKSTAVTIKSVTDDTVTVAGYGVLFGGIDLHGETFTKSTDFMLDLVPNKLVLYDHGMNEGIKSHIIGKIAPDHITEDEDGLWIEAELSRHAAYMDYVVQLAEDGKLGWSSGSVGHLTAREGKTIKRWPIVEFSLTPTPAEPRTLGVEVLKSLAEAAPALKELSTVGTGTGDALPAPDDSAVDIKESGHDEGETDTPEEAKATASAPVPDAKDDSTVDVNAVSDKEDVTMSEETKATKPEAVADWDAINEKLSALVEIVTGNSKRFEDLGERVAKIEDQPEPGVEMQTPTKAPKTIKSLGDNAKNAWHAFYSKGDVGGVKHLQVDEGQYSIKASNDTTMNITTDADGGYAVPTGHYEGIITKMDEVALYQRLGVMQIPGVGTTVNVPVDNEADGEFVSTAESTAFDRDAPAISQVQMTLVKYTKKIDFTVELLQDENSRLMEYVNRRVGFGLAKTHNNLLVTEILANGTAGLTLDGTSAITAAEVPELAYKLKGEYADGAAWLMDRATEGHIMGKTGNNFQFVPTPYGDPSGSQATGAARMLFGRPVFNTAKMPDIGGGNKSLVFGNFEYVGMRLEPELTVLRDPYSRAGYGEVIFHYYFRTVYKVMIAEAIQYATHPTA